MNTAKLFLVSFTLLMFSINSIAQDVRYSYDASGNRVKREVITIGNPNMRGATTDSTHQNEHISKNGVMEVRLTSNPTKGNLDVTILPNETNITNTSFQILVIDNQGKTIINRKETITNFNINLESYSAGIYYLSIIADKEVSQWKIIKK
ncbi:MAG: T9SS type A sorting domain-containing protein [Vicingaceae bacterium]|nr:T9SS type A sorting domain-containing protein [Vicingaceae bacterium]